MPDEADPGAGLVNLCFAGTGALVATSAAAAALPDTFATVHAGLSVVLFVVGTAALLWAYALGVARSRVELIGIPGLFLLGDGAAPAPTRRAFRIALLVQVVVVVAAAAVRPFTEVAFGILAPMFGLGLMGMWGGRHGTFPPRPPKQAA
ncbi:MAG: hypothetical protein ABL966_12250 [Acidimicrobiales bacterium]